MRILLVRLRQIGDVVFTTPAVHALLQPSCGGSVVCAQETA